MCRPAWLFLAWFIGHAAGCVAPEGDPIQVRLNQAPLSETTSTPARPKLQPLRFVVANISSPGHNSEAYEHFAEYLSQRLQRPVEIVRRRTYLELNELLNRGVAQAGLLCPGAYVIGREEFGLRALVIPVVNGNRTYQALLVVRRGSRFRTLADLRGASFAFSDPLSNTGFLYIAARLMTKGYRVDEYFGNVSFTYSHDNTIHAVRDGIADAGLVNSLVWNWLERVSPSDTRALDIIERSPLYPNNPVVVSPAAPPGLADALERILLAMDTETYGHSILKQIDIDRFVPATDTDFDIIDRNWHAVGRIHKGRPHRP